MISGRTILDGSGSVRLSHCRGCAPRRRRVPAPPALRIHRSGEEARRRAGLRAADGPGLRRRSGRDHRQPLDISDPATPHKYVFAQDDPVDEDEIDPSGQSGIFEYQWLSTVENRVYQLGLHSAHHPFAFRILGILYCVHLQLDYWTPGVSGSNVNVFRIPLFPLCSDTLGVPF
jgi:hypothetical protein